MTARMLHCSFYVQVIALMALFTACTTFDRPENKIDDYLYKGQSAAEMFQGQERGLVRAACRGNREGVEQAVKEGADPNAYGSMGLTPILVMFECRSPEGISLLVQNGADPNKLDEDGDWLPLAVAAHQNSPIYLEALLTAGAEPNLVEDVYLTRSTIRGAADTYFHTGRWDNLDTLVANGYDIEFYDNEGTYKSYNDFPKHMASSRLSTLFQVGAPCKARDYIRDGSTAGDISSYRQIQRNINRGLLFLDETRTTNEQCVYEIYQIFKDRYADEDFDQLRKEQLRLNRMRSERIFDNAK